MGGVFWSCSLMLVREEVRGSLVLWLVSMIIGTSYGRNSRPKQGVPEHELEKYIV